MPVRRHPVAVPKHSDPLALVPIDLALVRRLRKTYELLRSEEPRFAELFYSKLFAVAPQLRPMFKDPAAQSRKLTAALDAVVANLERPAETASMLADMGRRHADYGATPQLYDLVVALLIEAMGEALRLPPEDASLEEWRTALRLISAQMIAAAERGSAKLSTLAKPGPHTPAPRAAHARPHP